MRVVFDTNVLIDGVRDDFTYQSRLIDAVLEGRLEAFSTHDVEREYHLLVDRTVTEAAYREKVDQFLDSLQTVAPAAVDIDIDDSEDVKFFGAARGAGADIIISSDRHLLDVGEWDGIDVVTPEEAWRRYEDASEESGEWKSWARGLGIGLVFVAMIPVSTLAAGEEDELNIIEKQIQNLTAKRDAAASEAAKAQAAAELVAGKLKAAQLEIQKTKGVIASVNENQKNIAEEVETISSEVDKSREHIGVLIRALHEQEQTSLVHMFFDTWSLGDVLAYRAVSGELTRRLTETVQLMHQRAEELEKKQAELEAQEEEATRLQGLMVAQEEDLSGAKKEQDTFFSLKQGEKATYEHKLKEAQEARREIEQRVFRLKNAKVEVNLTNALDMARYAGKLTGVRPALLLGVLRVESNVGVSIGSGKFPDDMHPRDHDAFRRIAGKLGKKPQELPISARPKSLKGWGGAMGPGQIMPTTWEGIEGTMLSMTGKAVVSPYELSDAFVATAVMLGGAGAHDAAREREAVGRYIAGPNWQYYGWYVDRVFAVAEEYEHEL